MGRIRHFLSLADCSREEILGLLRRSEEMKKGFPGKGLSLPLEGRMVGMIFEKPSTRTRVSFDVAVHQLGGHSVFLHPRDIQIGRGEPIKDTARVLARYLDAVVVRTFAHSVLEEFATWSSVPVVNALSDLLHPCQVLGDLLTIKETGLEVTTMRAAWVGDGNNMANTWIHAAARLGFELRMACPKGYDPSVEYQSKNILLCRDPFEAVKDADVVSTDVWASMGQEREIAERRKVFSGFQVNDELLSVAKENVRVLHCLPAHRGEEITNEIMESESSIIWDQAENRLHVQKAVLEMLIGA